MAVREGAAHPGRSVAVGTGGNSLGAIILIAVVLLVAVGAGLGLFGLRGVVRRFRRSGGSQRIGHAGSLVGADSATTPQEEPWTPGDTKQLVGITVVILLIGVVTAFVIWLKMGFDSFAF